MKKVADHFYPHFATEEYCLCVRDHYVYKYIYKSNKLERYFKIPPGSSSLLGRIKDKFARSFLGRKLNVSLGLSHVFELPSKTVIVIYDKVYRFDPNQHSDSADIAFSLEEVGALPPLRNGIGINPDTGDCYFSEYSNDPYSAKSIYKISDDGRKISKVFEFASDQIKHVHSITWDKYRRRFWVTTGDSNEQSWFYYSDDNFKSLHRFAGGDQTWRAVSLVPIKDGLVWGMDAGKDASANDINYIYHLNFDTKDRTKVQRIDAPAYHVCLTSSGKIVMAVNYEPGCKQNISAEAAIWCSEDGKQWKKVIAMPYLPTPKINGSKYAYVYSPMGTIPDDCYLYTATNVSVAPMQMQRMNIV